MKLFHEGFLKEYKISPTRTTIIKKDINHYKFILFFYYQAF